MVLAMFKRNDLTDSLGPTGSAAVSAAAAAQRVYNVLNRAVTMMLERDQHRQLVTQAAHAETSIVYVVVHFHTTGEALPIGTGKMLAVQTWARSIKHIFPHKNAAA